MKPRLALVSLVALLAFPAPALATNVRTEWRVLAIACDVAGDEAAVVGGAAARMEACIERALPDFELELVTSFLHTAGPDLPGSDAFARDAALMDGAINSFLRGGAPLDPYDIVVVFSDRVEAAMGWMGNTFPLKDGRALAVCCVCTKPSSKLAHVWLNFIPRGPLRPILLLLEPWLKDLLDTEWARAWNAGVTAVHEFGHHLMPGDQALRHDGRLGAGIDDGDERENTDGHGLDCVMYKTLSPAAVWAKFRAGGPDMVAFCARCRARLRVRGPRAGWR